MSASKGGREAAVSASVAGVYKAFFTRGKLLTLQVIFIVSVLILTGCNSSSVPNLNPTATPVSNQAVMPNPASVYCEQQGYKSEIRTAADGSQYGVCVFPDGSECDEWAYYRGECGPETATTPSAGLPNPASVYCEQQGYKSEIRTAADGSQYGVCVFPDGSECDEWAYYRGECGPPR
jgi:putative hemolysin